MVHRPSEYIMRVIAGDLPLEAVFFCRKNKKNFPRKRCGKFSLAERAGFEPANL